MGIEQQIEDLKKQVTSLEKSRKSPKKKKGREKGTAQEMVGDEKQIKALVAEKERIAKAVEKAKEGKKGIGKFLTGARGVLAQGALNKRIGDIRRETNLQRRVRVAKAQEELSNIQARTAARRKASAIDLGRLPGGGVNTGAIKAISEKDIFG